MGTLKRADSCSALPSVELIPVPEPGGKRRVQDGFLVLLLWNFCRLWRVVVTPESLHCCLGVFPVTPAETLTTLLSLRAS